VSRAIAASLHEEAVAHAHLAEQSGELMWKHIHAEYTQDVHAIADTLATDAPLAWTLAREADELGNFHFLTGTTVDEIRGQYETLRTTIEIHDWKALTEIRQGWYTVTQGVVTLKMVPGGDWTRGETVTMFPNGADGILGELQVGTVGRLDDGRAPSDGGRLPEIRLRALARHEAYVDALRAEDVAAIVAAHRPRAAIAIRNYLTDESTLLDVSGASALAAHFTQLFERYRVLEVRLVNRIAETWYVFAELHWIVEERSGSGRTLAFCTAELSPFDADGRYWVRTGAGTDPIEA
jgi:hypothetical protein